MKLARWNGTFNSHFQDFLPDKGVQKSILLETPFPFIIEKFRIIIFDTSDGEHTRPVTHP